MFLKVYKGEKIQGKKEDRVMYPCQGDDVCTGI